MSTDAAGPHGRWWSNRVAIVGIVLGTAAGLAGIAVAQEGDTSDSNPPPWAENGVTQPLQFSRSLQETGPGMSSDEAVAQALRGLDDPSVTSATVSEAPVESGGAGPWLSVEVAGDQGHGVKARWLARLIQGAVDDSMRTDQPLTSDLLGGGQVTYRDGSGDQVLRYTGYGKVVGGQFFDSPSDDLLRQQVEDAAQRFDLGVTSIQFLHPLETALAVKIDVPEGAVAWTLDDLEEAIEGSTPNVEGLYVELDSSTGEPLLQTGYAFRVPGGSMWFAKGQDERFGVSHG